MNKYDVFLDRGTLKALDQDTGDIFYIMIEYNDTYKYIASSLTEEVPYELYEENEELILLNTDTGSTFKVVLEK